MGPKTARILNWPAVCDVPFVMRGKWVDNFQILSEIGSGSMGSVYLAEDAEGRRRAVKVLHSHLEREPGIVARFEREAAVGVRMRHANLVRTYGLHCWSTWRARR